MRTAIAIGAGFAVLGGSGAFAAEPRELAPLAFLVGEWTASGTGQPGPGQGSAAFVRSLQGQVILRTSYAEYPASGGKPAWRHDDLMVIYAVPGIGARAEYYDSEGHVIRYVVQSPSVGQVVFLSEASAGEPRFRLSYGLEARGVLKGEFAIAPADSHEAFQQYLRWESHKTTALGK